MDDRKLDLNPLSLVDASSRRWTLVVAYGVALFIVGVLALMEPLATGFTAGLLFGCFLLLYSLFAITAGVTSLSGRGRWIEILLGLLAILAGVAVFYNPFEGAATLAWAIGAWLFLSGVSHVGYALRATHDRGWRILLGIIDTALGAYLFLSGPAVGISFVAAALGISFVLRGAFLVNLGFGMKRLDHVGRA